MHAPLLAASGGHDWFLFMLGDDDLLRDASGSAPLATVDAEVAVGYNCVGMLTSMQVFVFMREASGLSALCCVVAVNRTSVWGGSSSPSGIRLR